MEKTIYFGMQNIWMPNSLLNEQFENQIKGE